VKLRSLIILFLLMTISYSYAQKDSTSMENLRLLDRRQATLTYGTLGTYVAGSTALYFAWYRQNPQSGFHLFDDSREWLQMDKMGHVFSAYSQSVLMYKSMQWAGYDDDKSIFYSTLLGLGFQTTIEVMDGFSSKWGFSYTDCIANVVGVTGFAIQQKLWKEQRLSMKMSYWPVTHSSEIISSESGQFSIPLERRVDALFGSGVEGFLKDYNGQTIWLSVDVASFIKDSNWPKWLSIAAGYSGENMYGGFENKWKIDNENYILDPISYQRHRQYILALDYNLSAIRTKSRFVNTVLDLLNLLKWPAPAIEYNRVDGLQFHLLFLN